MVKGDLFETKHHGLIEILEVKNSRNVSIRFLETGWETNVRSSFVLQGNIRDRMARTIDGVGYLGQKDFSKHAGYTINIYNRWVNMLRRCYCSETLLKHPSYSGCTVSSDWHDLSAFAEWCITNPSWHNGKWELDKDILFKGNRVYSPSTCCFVPSQINNLFVSRKKLRGQYPIGVSKVSSIGYRAQCQGIDGKLIKFPSRRSIEDAFQDYKVCKESVIKTVADKYKDSLEPSVYQALINYKVEVSD